MWKKQFYCALCSFKTKNKVLLEKHMMNKHVNKTSKCKYCKIYYKKKNHNLKEHEIIRAKKHKCEHCEFVTLEPNELVTHLRQQRHGSVSCDKCG